MDLEKIKLQGRTAAETAAAIVREEALRARLNEDVRLRAIREEGAQAIERVQAAIAAAYQHLAAGGAELLSDPLKLGRVTGSLIAIAAGAFISREAAVIARHMLARRFARPALVRETSRCSGLWAMLIAVFVPLGAFLVGTVRFICRLKAPEVNLSAKMLEGIIFGPTVKRIITDLALSLARAHSRSAPLRHVLLYGPPGTGKTMVAKRLAYLSGLDYAIMTGGDLGPLGQAAVSELHLLLSWAKSSPRGLLLFMDEAEAALADRRKCAMSEVAQNVLNTMLYHTGAQSSHFMLVLATNRPSDLDEALLDRMDEVVHVGLPGLEERLALTSLYFRKAFPPPPPPPSRNILIRGWAALTGSVMSTLRVVRLL